VASAEEGRRDAGSRPYEPTTLVSNRPRAVELVGAASACSFFGGLYVRSGDALFLGAATTALALIAFWIAEHQLSQRGGR
jgi:hypothetical protein